MGYLSTHVLDQVRGGAAAGVTVELWRLDPDVKLAEAVTDAAGRVAALAEEAGFVAGRYELRFHMGAYFSARGEESWLEVVPVRVRLAPGQGHYHVPLLCSPFAYTTYRGS